MSMKVHTRTEIRGGGVCVCVCEKICFLAGVESHCLFSKLRFCKVKLCKCIYGCMFFKQLTSMNSESRNDTLVQRCRWCDASRVLFFLNPSACCHCLFRRQMKSGREALFDPSMTPEGLQAVFLLNFSSPMLKPIMATDY